MATNSCSASTSCPEEVHLGDIGTIFRATINDCTETNGVATQTAIDISSATTLELIFKSPKGVVKTFTAGFTTDGSDGQIQYTTILGDLDEVGNWKIQAYIVLPTGSWRSDIGQFRVHENL